MTRFRGYSSTKLLRSFSNNYR